MTIFPFERDGPNFFDALETRSPEQREIEQFELLVAQLQHAKEHSVAYSALLRMWTRRR
ncbi:MAG: hypothetical protein CM1200mP41_08830 [Gammaproteobacteria bacterium]|nr:MAG: hypothetical protein CM1200mP41_08830 [Gammaproteobacteria bacterium]